MGLEAECPLMPPGGECKDRPCISTGCVGKGEIEGGSVCAVLVFK